MGRIYRTARGKGIDLDKLKLTNENVVAVGNMRVNARGDLLGAGNQIAAGRNQVMDQVYAVEEAPYSPNDPKTFQKQRDQIQAQAAKELEKVIENKIEPTVETTTKTEVNVTTSAPRGSLASSIKKS